MPGNVRDRAVAGYLAHLVGCALSGRRSDGLPAGCSWEDVVSRAKNNSVLGLVWRAARELNGIPEEVSEPSQRFSDMVALCNVRYEAERARGLSVMSLKGANLVALYPDYSMREVGDNDVQYGFVGLDADGSLHGPPDPDGSSLARAQEAARGVMEELGYRLVAGPDGC